MNGALAVNLKITAKDYLQGEQVADRKHEYHYGDVYAMAGASRTHNKLSGNAFVQLWQHLRHTECDAYAADMKVGIAEDQVYFYPDIVVCCDQQDNDDYVSYAPIIIIEVLSTSTEAFDRGEKFRCYRQIPCLREYVLISQERPCVDIFRLSPQGEWVINAYTQPTDKINLTSIDFSCQLAELYEGIDLLLDQT